MRIVLGAMLMLGMAGIAYADTSASTGQSASDTLQQLEKEWSEASQTGDTNKVNQLLAEDWVGISYDGTKFTKQALIEALKSGKMKAASVELGPMDVKVLGKVAVVQGSDDEKSTVDGKDTSGKWVWMDVFVKHGGTWVVVRSQSARVQ